MEKYHLHNRPDRELTNPQEITEILKNGKFTTISMCRNNEPYIVTLSYGYDATENALYFHCAPQGLKLDFLASNPQICATVIEDGGYVETQCEHNFRSVVFRGTMHRVSDPELKKHGMEVLLRHLEPDNAVVAEKLAKTENYYSRMEILKLEISQIHAKAGK
jgi:nitroimidazol reductase NimA-like FMN-containing flavoprotein (pyridoxamine 5'-phosphate oxidase superfamily)